MSESAEEIIASLGVDADEDVLVELDEQLDAADEIQALEEHAANVSTKLVLVGTGSTIYAKFQPGPTGRGACHKKGTGVFTGPRIPSSLRGSHRLEVGRLTVQLYRGHTRVWKGLGAQKGLSGTWNVTF